MSNNRRAFRFYCQFMLIACEANEFKIPIEFPDGSIREVYFKVEMIRRLALLEDSNRESSSSCASGSELLPLHRKQF